jgi:hypothetical protein
LQDHPVESGSQLPDFVARLYFDRLIEVTCLDRPRTLQQLPDRASNATADEVGKDQSNNRGKHRHDRGDQDGLSLLRPDRCDGTIAHRQHVRANGVNLFIEFIAERVDLRKAASRCCEISGIEFCKQRPRLLLQVAAGVAHQAIDPALDASQRGIVRGRTGVVNYRIDELARCLRLAIDFNALRVVKLLAKLIPHLIGRVLHFCDHHPANRESSFKQ